MDNVFFVFPCLFYQKQNLHCKNILVRLTFPVLILMNSNIKRVILINNGVLQKRVSVTDWSKFLLLLQNQGCCIYFKYLYTVVIPYHATEKEEFKTNSAAYYLTIFHVLLYLHIHAHWMNVCTARYFPILFKFKKKIIYFLQEMLRKCKYITLINFYIDHEGYGLSDTSDFSK